MYSDEQVQLEIDYPSGGQSRLLALVKTILVLPHYVVLIVLGIGGFFVYVASWWAVLFTGRYPEGMFNYMVGLHRYQARVMAWVFQMTDRYPPFSMADDPTYPVRLTVQRPARTRRWRALFAYFLAIPVLFASGVMMLLGLICVFFAWLSILVTGRYPRGLFTFVSSALRWSIKSALYSEWIAVSYPLSPA